MLCLSQDTLVAPLMQKHSASNKQKKLFFVSRNDVDVLKKRRNFGGKEVCMNLINLVQEFDQDDISKP